MQRRSGVANRLLMEGIKIVKEKILDRSIYIPAIFIVLATSSLLESLAYKKKGRNTSFLLSIIVIVFLYIVSFL